MKRNHTSFGSLFINPSISPSNSSLILTDREPLLSRSERREIDFHDIKTSVGKPRDEKIFTIEFEGDGPLGLNFIYDKPSQQMKVSSIIENTLAQEYDFVEPNLIVHKINGHNVGSSTFEENMSRIKYIWKRQSEITIEFKKTCELSEDNRALVQDVHINTLLYEILRKVNCEYYYNDFVRLGAKNIDDFEFIEYTDLVEMNMSLTQRKDFCITYQIELPIKDKNSGVFEVPSDPNMSNGSNGSNGSKE